MLLAVFLLLLHMLWTEASSAADINADD